MIYIYANFILYISFKLPFNSKSVIFIALWARIFGVLHKLHSKQAEKPKSCEMKDEEILQFIYTFIS